MSLFERVLAGLKESNSSLTTLKSNYTAGDLQAIVSKYESMLRPLDIAGKRVALLVPAIQEYIPLFMTVNKLRGVTAPLSWQFRQEDLQNVLDFLDPHIIFTVNEHTGFNFSEAVTNWAKDKGKEVLVFTSDNCISWETRLFQGESIGLETSSGEIICFTSGSTGIPKGMVFKEEVVDYSFNHVSEALELKPTDRVLVYASTSTIFSLYSMDSVLKAGANLLVANEFDLIKIIDMMKNSNCNKVATTPSVFKALYTFASKLNPEVLTDLELICFVGEKIPNRLIDSFPLMGNSKFISHYGSSETSALANALLERESKELEYELVAGAQAKAVEGELYVITEALFSGYYGNPQLTQEVFEDSWYKTGDLVEFLDDKRFKIVGRKKDIIKKGGQQVVPSEIEQIIATINGVRSVAVVGSAHPIYGEQIVAFVVADGLTSADIRNYCIGKISAYKVPDKVVFIDKMPLNQGKTDKLKLRAVLN
ncbi:class I adenylate-forming enzyme family protein [Pullulanibacillus sp. KACC 23026]|uniref:class I adenylate-forming enzyme family protein n=1 Tax=Pullulanibacillus sp. KACC 23026 TaxID=3028315 RepID=UPI0023AE9027|nr:class I adenylate-forming enzyme family protein [Pullulanibacillus sp. KACC 23026]WEG12467.1 class I adenylate-forming enzyme family protein [Pullulanibacillus sp. KACC 23026]